MKPDIENEVKKLYKQGASRDEIINYLVNKYNKQSSNDKFNDICVKITLLENKKEQIKNSKFMDKEDKDTYYFGIVVVLIVSGMLFYEIPILIPINLITYSALLPAIKAISKLKKEKNIKKELEILNIIKECLDNKVDNEEKVAFIKLIK